MAEINDSLIASICADIEDECGYDLAQRAIDLVKGQLPNGEVTWSAMGMLMIAIGILHTRMVVTEANLPTIITDHTKECEDCRERIAKRIIAYKWGGDSLGKCVEDLAVSGAVLELGRGVTRG